jgi:hypothetical protein
MRREKNLLGKHGIFTQLAITQCGFLMHSSMICVSRLMFESRHISLALIRNFGVRCGHELRRTSGVALFCCPTKCMNLLLSPSPRVDAYRNISRNVARRFPSFSNSNDWIRVNNELKCGINRNFKVLHRHLPGETDKNHKSFSQYSWCPRLDSNQIRPEYRSEEF